MLQKFLDYLLHEKRYSAHTLSAYESDLKQFSDFLVVQYSIQHLTESSPEILRSWIAALSGDDIAARSISRKLSSAKAFFKWCMKYHGLTSNPASGLTLPRISKRLPVYVEEEQMMLLPEEVFPEGYIGTRDRAIVELLYHTGMRSAELVGLEISSIDHQAFTIKILGKRNKERIVPVSQHILQILDAYAEERDSLSIIKNPASFFLTEKGAKIYPKLVYRVVNHYLGRVSSLRKKSPHVLRHTFATHMLNRGADLNAIKELLGHSSLAATQVYTHNSIEQLKEIHRKAHPKGWAIY